MKTTVNVPLDGRTETDGLTMDFDELRVSLSGWVDPAAPGGRDGVADDHIVRSID